MVTRDQLATQMLACSQTLKNLITQIADLEKDQQLSLEEKSAKIKKIRAEIKTVGTDIANLKTEIKLIETYSIN